MARLRWITRQMMRSTAQKPLMPPEQLLAAHNAMKSHVAHQAALTQSYLQGKNYFGPRQDRRTGSTQTSSKDSSGGDSVTQPLTPSTTPGQPLSGWSSSSPDLMAPPDRMAYFQRFLAGQSIEPKPTTSSPVNTMPTPELAQPSTSIPSISETKSSPPFKLTSRDTPERTETESDESSPASPS